MNIRVNELQFSVIYIYTNAYLAEMNDNQSNREHQTRTENIAAEDLMD